MSALRRDVSGEVLVPAGLRLVATLWEHDLVDELRLVVVPVVVGAGRGLFGAAGPGRLRLTEAGPLDEDLAVLVYAR